MLTNRDAAEKTAKTRDSGQSAEWTTTAKAVDDTPLPNEQQIIEPPPKTRPAKPTRQWVPFPTQHLPRPIRDYVEGAARSIGCCESFVALPMLTALAAAVGSTYVLARKPDHLVPAILWAAVVAKSGAIKSAPFDAATRFILERQQDAIHRSRHFAEAEKLGDGSSDGAEYLPESQAERYLTGDPTVESLAMLLAENPRGLLLARDELSGWLGNLDRYANTKGGDEAAYLSMYGGRAMHIDRKGGKPKYLFVPQAYLSITGTIQPGVMKRCMGPARQESGLKARFLLAWPPKRKMKLIDDSVPESLIESVRSIFDKLFALQPARDETGKWTPNMVRLSGEALEVYRQYFDRNSERHFEAEDNVAATLSKLQETPLRIALLFHLIRVSTGESVEPFEVDAATMQTAVALGDWFCNEIPRCYELLSESPDEADQRRLLDWIIAKGGAVQTAHVQRGCRWLRRSGAARAALEALSLDGLGRWEKRPNGETGNTVEWFVLNQDVDTLTS